MYPYEPDAENEHARRSQPAELTKQILAPVKPGPNDPATMCSYPCANNCTAPIFNL
jgi:hypothetical protein